MAAERPIVIDVTAAAMSSGGIGRYAGELANHLAVGRHAEAITFVAGGWGGERRMPAPSGWQPALAVRRIAGSARALRVRIATSLLAGSLDRTFGRPGILHLPEPHAPRLEAGRAIITVHDLTHRLLPECHSRGNRMYLDWVLGRSVRRAARIVADSESTKRDLVAEFRLPADRVQVIYPGVAGFFSPADADVSAETARRLGLEGPFLLTVGTLEPRKNLPFLVRAFGRLTASHGYPGCLAIVGGPGWGNVPIEDAARAAGVHARVRMLGRLDDETLRDLYTACDAFALPSLYEGFGLPVVEALACGAPVVVSDRGSLPEVTGDAGTVLPLGDPDAWGAALADACSADANARARTVGPRQAARFRFDAAARAFESIYDALIA